MNTPNTCNLHTPEKEFGPLPGSAADPTPECAVPTPPHCTPPAPEAKDGGHTAAPQGPCPAPGGTGEADTAPQQALRSDPAAYPGKALRWGDSGEAVRYMQRCLNHLGTHYTAINTQTVDGKFGRHMYEAVVRFQGQFGLDADGVIGPRTWSKIVTACAAMAKGEFLRVCTPYPGCVIAEGSSGDQVRYIQSYLSAAHGMAPVKVDGKFGPDTLHLVRSFQRSCGLKVDGLVGHDTWHAMIAAFNEAH